jgi:hypothetical protein
MTPTLGAKLRRISRVDFDADAAYSSNPGGTVFPPIYTDSRRQCRIVCGGDVDRVAVVREVIDAVGVVEGQLAALRDRKQRIVAFVGGERRHERLLRRVWIRPRDLADVGRPLRDVVEARRGDDGRMVDIDGVGL